MSLQLHGETYVRKRGACQSSRRSEAEITATALHSGRGLRNVDAVAFFARGATEGLSRMSFRIVHALWDDKEGRVALFLNPDDQFARWRTRYEIYLTVGGQHGGHREFLGIFDASKPVARDWPDLPAWVMLPVLRGAIAFSLELQPHRPGTGAGPLRLDFDATVIFDYRRRGVLDEERFYCWQADSSGGRAGAFERKRHLFIMDQRAEDIAGAQVLEVKFRNASLGSGSAPLRGFARNDSV